MKTKFKNKIAIVTGASSGIGKATAIALAQKGAHLVLIARNERKLNQVSNEINDLGAQTMVVAADVSDQIAVINAVQKIISRFGKIDILFNNAGISKVGKVMDENYIEITRHMFEVDYLGSVYMTRAVIPFMEKTGGGQILNMSSVVGRKAFAGFTGYSSIMHAIDGFSDGLRQELKNSTINVATIYPALTQTALLEHEDPDQMPGPFSFMTPIPPEEVARAVIKGLAGNVQKIIVPFPPRIMLFVDALSSRWSDRFVRWISKKHVARFIGMYKGKNYHQQADASLLSA